ncbi:MAG: DUF5313 family protein [Sciscionella sp.]
MSGSRPGVLRWVYYAFGGRLPLPYAQWVLHDLTCRTWFLRHSVRMLVQLTPTPLLLLVPGPMSIVVYLPLFLIFGGLLIALPYANESRDHRLMKHGFIPEIVLRQDPE